MGQYFYLTNFDKKQYIYAHGIGNGLKIAEQTGFKYSVQKAGRLLLSKPDSRHPLIGAWRGDHVAFLGDEGGCRALDGYRPAPCPVVLVNQDDFTAFRDTLEDISPLVREMFLSLYGVSYKRNTGGSGFAWRIVS